LATVSTSLDESEQFADNEVELRRVGGVNAPVVSRDPVSNFLHQSHRLQNCKLGHDSRRARTHRRHNSTLFNSIGYILNMFSFQIFVGSRRELVANSIHTADAEATPTRLNSTVCIGH